MRSYRKCKPAMMEKIKIIIKKKKEVIGKTIWPTKLKGYIVRKSFPTLS